MNKPIEIISNIPSKDAAGFAVNADTTIARTRAYKEDKHGNERWANMAVFSSATTLFRFRKIPGVTVDTTMFILCDANRYNIISAEDVRGKGMYVEVLAERITPSKK